MCLIRSSTNIAASWSLLLLHSPSNTVFRITVSGRTSEPGPDIPSSTLSASPTWPALHRPLISIP
uniref:Uncharacterized protein n=1 Tax=Arundo donax TaxID=35708 RepID=A0A0A8ZFS9_ARUDO